jgi:hypothetical protein
MFAVSGPVLWICITLISDFIHSTQSTLFSFPVSVICVNIFSTLGQNIEIFCNKVQLSFRFWLKWIQMRQNDADPIGSVSTTPQHCLTQIYIAEQYIKIIFYFCREAYSAAGIGDASVRGL